MILSQGISAFPDGDNLLSWIGTVEGPIDSVYEGLKYKLRLEFPAGKLHKNGLFRSGLDVLIISA